jgi:hypothetical protein
VSTESPSASRQQMRRSRILRPIKLSTFLLLVLVIALLIALYAQHLREARLQDGISVYRHYKTEGIIEALEQPIALPYTDDAPLDQVLRELKRQTANNPKLPKIPTGIPIYVDPIGLQEAERSLNSTVKRPPAADALPLGEHLRLVLDQLGLDYMVKDGFMMITSKESVDEPLGENADPYLQYRDVLR